MKNSASLARFLYPVCCWLYAFLFTYASVSKLIDFENFGVQLSQSPLLSAFASIVAIAIPAIEIVLAIFLAFDLFRLLALYLSYLLMAMFTAYIFIILHYSSFVPCSCGGILEKMTWMQHLWFNVAFMVLAFAAILTQNVKEDEKVKI